MTVQSITPTEEPQRDEQEVKRAAYSQATTRLRNEQRAVFNRILGEEYAKVGITWSPPLTDEQKAEKTIEELLAKYPGLADRFTEAEDEPEPDGDDEEGHI